MALKKTIGDWLVSIWDRIGAPVGASISADVAAVKTDTGNVASRLGTPAAGTVAGDVESIEGKVDDIKTQTDKIAVILQPPVDFWSDPVEEKAVTNIQVTAAVGAVVEVAGLPDGAAVVRAIVMMKFRMVENTNVAPNSLDCAAVQPIQVDNDEDDGWVSGINFVDEQFKMAAETREGGDVIIGKINVVARVDGNDIYDFQWLNAKAHLANIQFNDIQMGIRIWYTI